MALPVRSPGCPHPRPAGWRRGPGPGAGSWRSARVPAPNTAGTDADAAGTPRSSRRTSSPSGRV